MFTYISDTYIESEMYRSSSSISRSRGVIL